MAAEYPGVVRRIRDERALDMLLMPLAGQDGYRTVSKKGVKADRGIFIAPELGRCIGQRVQVRISRTDKRYAYIYDEAGLFVCRAHNVADLTPEEQRTISVDARNAAQSVKAETRRLRLSRRSTTSIRRISTLWNTISGRPKNMRPRIPCQRRTTWTT